MGLYSGLAVYFVIWWITLFMILPWGVRRPEDHELEPGQEHGAPVKPRLLLKMAINTVVAGVIFALFYYGIESGLISFRE